MSNNIPNIPKGARLGFAIFMVLFYVAFGILCIMDVFNFYTPGITITLGIILIIYGIWRGYRLYRVENNDPNSDNDSQI